MPKDALKMTQNDLLYSKKKVVIPTSNANRRVHYTNATNAENRRDGNLTNRIAIL